MLRQILVQRFFQAQLQMTMVDLYAFLNIYVLCPLM